jgi:hypothetical protein
MAGTTRAPQRFRYQPTSREAAMNLNPRTRILATATTAVGLVAPLLVAAAPASAQGGGGGVAAHGACTNGGTFALKAKHDDGRIEVEYEVDTNVAGQVWAVRIRDNGVLVVARNATTVAPSGSFTVAKRIANRTGTDTIRAHATFKAHTCGGKVTL